MYILSYYNKEQKKYTNLVILCRSNVHILSPVTLNKNGGVIGTLVCGNSATQK